MPEQQTPKFRWTGLDPRTQRFGRRGLSNTAARKELIGLLALYGWFWTAMRFGQDIVVHYTKVLAVVAIFSTTLVIWLKPPLLKKPLQRLGTVGKRCVLLVAACVAFYLMLLGIYRLGRP